MNHPPGTCSLFCRYLSLLFFFSFPFSSLYWFFFSVSSSLCLVFFSLLILVKFLFSTVSQIPLSPYSSLQLAPPLQNRPPPEDRGTPSWRGARASPDLEWNRGNSSLAKKNQLGRLRVASEQKSLRVMEAESGARQRAWVESRKRMSARRGNQRKTSPQR